MISVGIHPELRGLVVKSGVVDDGDCVGRPIGNPQLVGAPGVEFQIPGVIQVVEIGGDHNLGKPVTKGADDVGFLGLCGCGRHHAQQEDDKDDGGQFSAHGLKGLLIPFHCLLPLVHVWHVHNAEALAQGIAQSFNIEKRMVMTDKHQQNLIGVS